MKNSEFRELLLNAQGGNQASMVRLLEIFQPLVYKYSLEKGVLNEDCFQELNIRLIQCILNFKFDFNKKNTDILEN